MEIPFRTYSQTCGSSLARRCCASSRQPLVASSSRWLRHSSPRALIQMHLFIYQGQVEGCFQRTHSYPASVSHEPATARWRHFDAIDIKMTEGVSSASTRALSASLNFLCFKNVIAEDSPFTKLLGAMR